MRELKKIWLVSRGDYSDYRVEAAFTSKEKAEAYAFGFSDYCVEERDLNPDIGSRGIAKGYMQWRIDMAKDGEVKSIEKCGAPEDAFFSIWDEPQCEGLTLSAIVTAKTEKAAIKITNEKRAQFIAQDKWYEYADLESESR